MSELFSPGPLHLSQERLTPEQVEQLVAVLFPFMLYYSSTLNHVIGIHAWGACSDGLISELLACHTPTWTRQAGSIWAQGITGYACLAKCVIAWLTLWAAGDIADSYSWGWVSRAGVIGGLVGVAWVTGLTESGILASLTLGNITCSAYLLLWGGWGCEVIAEAGCAVCWILACCTIGRATCTVTTSRGFLPEVPWGTGWASVSSNIL